MPEITSHIDTHWQKLAHDYDSIMTNVPTMEALYEAIINNLPLSPSSILDLGTGTGVLLKFVNDLYPTAKLVGLDPAAAMLEHAREKFEGQSNISFINGSAHQIDAPSNHFDVVISNYALHHLNHDEKLLCAKEVHRVLKPNGRFIYGDQHCRTMGTPADSVWVEEMFDLLCDKAKHYLKTASLERMILQINLIPKFLLTDGEIPATVNYWLKALETAGFNEPDVVVIEPERLLNHVIVVTKN